MRVSQKSLVDPFQRNLNEIEYRKFKDQIRLSTGKNIVNLSDAPDKLVDAKSMGAMISSDENYRNIIDYAVGEMKIAEDYLQDISDKIANIRNLAIDSTQVGSSGNLYTLGVYIKGLLTDVVRDANADFNGKYLFSGTMTTPESILKQGYTNNMPYEIVEGTPNADNPSGLQIIYKGNFEDRNINKDNRTNEKINIDADSLFGAKGTEFFENIIKLYNLVSFKEDGNPRQTTDVFSKDDIKKVSDLQRSLADVNETINNMVSQNASRRLRMQVVSDQMNEEITRLKQFKSQAEDTDVAKTSMDLKMAETSFQYTLQVGSRLLSNSLLDFLD